MVAAQILARYFPEIKSAAWRTTEDNGRQPLSRQPWEHDRHVGDNTHFEEDGGTFRKGEGFPLGLSREGVFDRFLSEFGRRRRERAQVLLVVVRHRLRRAVRSRADLLAADERGHVERSGGLHLDERRGEVGALGRPRRVRLVDFVRDARELKEGVRVDRHGWLSGFVGSEGR